MKTALWIGLLALIGGADEPHDAALAGAGPGFDRNSIATYLRSLHPDPPMRRRIHAYIHRLASGSIAEREEATRRLGSLGPASIAQLEQAARIDDPEVQRRVHSLLVRARDQARPSFLFAVLKTIERRRFHGLASEILGAVAFTKAEQVIEAAEKALKATVGEQEGEFLLRTIKGDDKPTVRACAVIAFGQALRERSVPKLRSLLGDRAARVRLAGAWALADLGRHEALGALGALLEDPQAYIRTRAAAALRQISGQQHGFSPHDAPETRADSVSAWKEWIRSGGPNARWKTPLQQRGLLLGRTLVTLYQQNRVIELDARGNKVWEWKGGNRPWAVTGLSNGHRIIGMLGSNRMVEFDAAGKKVWEKKGLPGAPVSIQRLDNGNTLSVCGSQIVEIAPSGRLVWKLPMNGGPSDAKRLDNGNTLVTLLSGNRVVEIDRKGRMLWQIKGCHSPYYAQRLPNGNTLVGELAVQRKRKKKVAPGGRIVEYDRAGKVRWQKTGLQNCYSGQRLPSGRTLIVDTNGVREIGRDGQERWIKKLRGQILRAFRY